MIVRVKKRTHPYVQIDKRPIEDDRISWKSKGLLAYFLSRPDNWVIQIEQLCSVGPDGETAVQSALQELNEFGYARLEQVRSENGSRAMGKRWVIYEEPLTSRFSDSQETRQSEILTVRKSTPTNKEEESNKEKKTNKEVAIPEPLRCEEFCDAWIRWYAYRIQARLKRYTTLGALAQLAHLSTLGPVRAVDAINHSIAQNYQGIYEPKTNSGPTSSRTQENSRNDNVNKNRLGQYAGLGSAGLLRDPE